MRARCTSSLPIRAGPSTKAAEVGLLAQLEAPLVKGPGIVASDDRHRLNLGLQAQPDSPKHSSAPERQGPPCRLESKVPPQPEDYRQVQRNEHGEARLL
jgi:hypothetical protein